MLYIKIVIISPVLFYLCSACLLNQPQVSGLESVLTPPVSSCQTNITWIKKGENQWISTKGISLTLYEASTAEEKQVLYEDGDYSPVGSAYFWNNNYDSFLHLPDENRSEAISILKELEPGEEIDVTNFVRRVPHPWLIPVKHPQCLLPNADCAPSPYVIHYLHRPRSDWVIDRLMTRAKGDLRSESNPEILGGDSYIIVDGPYMPIFEGRFRHDGATFWFSARETETNQNLSTPEMRFATLQEINDFLASCVKTDAESN